MRLDAFLFGPATDPALESVPSVKLAAKQHEEDKFHLPIADDFAEVMGLPPTKKQKTTKEVAWPTLHKQVLERCEVPWPIINYQLYHFSVQPTIDIYCHPGSVHTPWATFVATPSDHEICVCYMIKLRV